jgi:hypothetical protein
LDAAKDQAHWAFGQLIVGLVGLFGLAATVVYARHAWKTAQEALADTRKNSDEQAAQFTSQLAVAQRHADIAEDTARKQLRAYVHAKSINIIWSNNGSPLFSVELQNSGQTPALDVRSGAYHIFGTTEYLAGINKIESGRPMMGGRCAIAANSPYKAALLVRDFEKIRPEQITEKTWLAVVGRVVYTDIFGTPYETDFGFFTSNAQSTDMSEFTGTHLAKFREVKPGA